jgi:hypothetical protein
MVVERDLVPEWIGTGLKIAHHPTVDGDTPAAHHPRTPRSRASRRRFQNGKERLPPSHPAQATSFRFLGHAFLHQLCPNAPHFS